MKYRGTNLGGGAWVQKSTLTTGLMVPNTPAPYSTPGPGGAYVVRDSIPPYPPGTSPSLQVRSGTEYWLTTADVDLIAAHGWAVRKWKQSAVFNLEVVNGQAFTVQAGDEEFYEAGDLINPARNLTDPGNAGFEYRYETSGELPPYSGGPQFIQLGVETVIGRLDNIGGWLEHEGDVEQLIARFWYKIAIGRFIYYMDGQPLAGAFARVRADYAVQLGVWDESGDEKTFYGLSAWDYSEPEPTLAPLFATGTTAWRTAPDTVNDPLGTCRIMRYDGTVYGGGDFGRRRELSMSNPLGAGMEWDLRWSEMQNPRAEI